MVSIPVRGKGIKTICKSFAGRIQQPVSIPVRGKGIKTIALTFTHIHSNGSFHPREG